MSSKGRVTGKIKWYNTEKRYGFIVRDDEEPDIFFHISAVPRDSIPQIVPWEPVEFSVVMGQKGKKQAEGIALASKGRVTGKIKWYNTERRYGFIVRDDEEPDIFFHISAVPHDSVPQIASGKLVEFSVVMGRKGKKQAEKITLAESNASVEKLIARLEEAGKKRFTFLLVGRTGVGKSSTVNTLLDQEVAEVGKFEPVTKKVESYETRIHGIPCTIVDTPGLCDDLPEEGKDDEYLKKIKDKVPEIDCVWFVTMLDDERIRSDEMRGIQLITDAFGEEIWRKAIIIFSRADKVSSRRYDEYLLRRTAIVRKEISRNIRTSSYSTDSIPSVAVTNVRQHTPDNKPWLGKLYAKVVSRISKNGLLPFIIATSDRVVFEDEGSSPSSVNDQSTFEPVLRSRTISTKRTEPSLRSSASNPEQEDDAIHEEESYDHEFYNSELESSTNSRTEAIIEQPNNFEWRDTRPSTQPYNYNNKQAGNTYVQNNVTNSTTNQIVLGREEEAEVEERVVQELGEEFTPSDVVGMASLGATLGGAAAGVAATAVTGAAIGIAAGPAGILAGAAIGAAVGFMGRLLRKKRLRG